MGVIPMRIPVQITFRTMPRSEAIEQSLRERAEKLDCYGTAVDEVCDQERCFWREDSLVESVAMKKAN
ncbi:MAG TPA: hypothetical protein VH660_01265 [Candidatus Deferrimicrobiaceae bacterium]|jgi:hypothetical protein